MNQTTWIVGGGVIIIALAAWLYMISGDGLPNAAPVKIESATTTLQADTTAQPPIETFATSTSPTITTMNTPKDPAPVPEAQPAVTKTVTPKKADESTAVLHTSMGDITLKFYASDAPKTVENFLKLAKSGFYDGVKFHRVIKGFMIQTGDPLSKDDAQAAKWGTGGPGYKFADEIDANSAIYQKGYKHGVLAMANSGPNTNGSQFFIMASDYGLPPLYTIFGEVTSGLGVVDSIDAVQTNSNDRPLTPVVITSVVVK